MILFSPADYFIYTDIEKLRIGPIIYHKPAKRFQSIQWLIVVGSYELVYIVTSSLKVFGYRL